MEAPVYEEDVFRRVVVRDGGCFSFLASRFASVDFIRAALFL